MDFNSFDLLSWYLLLNILHILFFFSLFCWQESYKKPNYVQISVESYSHLTGLEDEVKTYEEKVQTLEDEIKDLNDKLSAANSEMTTKENLVKQHAKVAEEAVSGMLLKWRFYLLPTKFSNVNFRFIV